MRDMIRSKLERLFKLYDFERTDTAVLNEMELLASKYGGGDEILKEVYRLRDQGGRNLGLRYDLTLPFAKLLAQNPGLPLPFKRYEIGKVFRDGPVKKGRLREFIQCDADIAGAEGPEAEAELMQLAAEAFRELGIAVEIRWNNRRFLGELLAAVEVPSGKSLSVMLTLDKLAKLETAEVKNELLAKGLQETVSAAVLQLADCKNPDFGELCREFGLEQGAGAAEVRALQSLINAAGLKEICRFDPFLSRGLSFYTGTVYEIFASSGEFVSSLGGGGRYDAITGRLAGSGDAAICPMAGLSFGIESIAELLKERPLQTAAAPAAAVIPIGAMSAEALQAAALLRESGIRTSTELTGRKLKKALAAADSRGVRYALLIGGDEAVQGMVRLKDMACRTETVMPLEQAVLIIGKNAGAADWS
ncbi:MAG: histidyl-tRNA synthetase [Paenibacillaceae bacterium]|nr:histidyl-tRNA synthetase [Paenibacillaceae bacterium]